MGEVAGGRKQHGMPRWAALRQPAGGDQQRLLLCAACRLAQAACRGWAGGPYLVGGGSAGHS